MKYNKDQENCKCDSSELEKVKAERDFYKKILDMIPAVVHVNNLQTEVVEWVNEFAQSLSGYEKSFILNNPEFLSAVIVDQDVEWMQESISDYMQLTGVYSNIYSIKHKDQNVHTYHGLGVIFETDEQNKPIRNLAIDIDISNEIRNYKQLKSHLNELTCKLRKTELNQITTTEQKVIKQLCKGNTIKEIGIELKRSPYTIDNHKRNIFKKLNVHKTSELVAWAKEVGIS